MTEEQFKELRSGDVIHVIGLGVDARAIVAGSPKYTRRKEHVKKTVRENGKRRVIHDTKWYSELTGVPIISRNNVSLKYEDYSFYQVEPTNLEKNIAQRWRLVAQYHDRKAPMLT